MNQINVNTIETQTVSEYVSEFKGYARKTVEGTLEMSRVVRDARNLKGKKDFGEFCELIGFDKRSSVIKKLSCIGKKYEILNKVKENLPSNWTTLYQISRIEDEQILALIQGGVIHQNMTGKEIKSFHDGIDEPQPSDEETLVLKDHWFRCTVQSDSDQCLETVRLVIQRLREEGLNIELSASLKETLELEVVN